MGNRILSFIALALLAGALAACGGGSSGAGGNLRIVAYSTPKEAYGELIPAFQRTPEGKDVQFTQSYGASGDQSRAVDSGLPADVVAFSLEPDITRLVESKKVAPTWNRTPTKGMVTNSVAVLAVRKGNPKNIKTWEDLTKPGVEVLTPNPVTSGGARWNVMAAYGSQIVQGKSEQEGIDFLKALFKNVVVQDKAARDALATFDGGKGDVLIAYENEAITAQKKGLELDYVIPDQTILIENPIAVPESSQNKAKAKAFVDFLQSDPAQRIFASHGYRPADEKTADRKRFPTPKQLFDITKFGGWDVVSKKFFDPEGSVMAEIEEGLGVSTGG